MTTLATLYVQLTANADGYHRVLDQAEKRAHSFSTGALNSLSTVGSSLLSGTAQVLKYGVAAAVATVAAGAVAATKILADSLEEAAAAQATQAQLAAVLESTGGVAGVTAEQVNGLADALSNVTLFEDDVVISGQNLLLTFTNIGKNVFPAATETMLDMSQALGQDLKASAIQLGKALQDPIEGVTALRRVGVNFTDAQQDMIKALVESGKLEEAQKFILQELQTEFGGSARAAGQTFAGQLQILKNNLGNVKETIGMSLLPVLSNLASMLNEKLADPRVQAFISDLADRLGRFGKAIVTTVQAVSQGGLMSLFTVFEDGSSYIGGFLEIFGMSESAANEWGLKIRNAVRDIQEGFQQTFTWLQENKAVVVATLAAIGTAIMVSVVTALASAAAAAAPLVLTMAAIASIAYLVYRAWTENWGGIQGKTAEFWAWLQPILQNLWNWLSVNVPLALETLKGLWDTAMTNLANLWTNVLQPAIAAVWANLSGTVFPFFAAFADFLSAVFGVVLTALAGIWQNVLAPALQTAWSWLSEKLGPAFQWLVDFWNGAGQPVVEKIAEWIGTKLTEAFGWLSEKIASVTDWLSGMADTLSNMSLPDWMTPGSPTPWEMGLWGVGDALDALSRKSLPSFNAELAGAPMPVGVGGISSTVLGSAQSGLGGGGMVVNINVASDGITDERDVARKIWSAVEVILRERGLA